MTPSSDRESLSPALQAAGLLCRHIYGRSGVPPLSALLQREFRPMPPLPLHRDSLLLSRPEWFESRARELVQVLQQQEADEQAAAAVAMEEDNDL